MMIHRKRVQLLVADCVFECEPCATTMKRDKDRRGANKKGLMGSKKYHLRENEWREVEQRRTDSRSRVGRRGRTRVAAAARDVLVAVVAHCFIESGVLRVEET